MRHKDFKQSLLIFSIYSFVLAVCIGLFAKIFMHDGFTGESTLLFARYTARFAFFTFLLVFLVRPLFVLSQSIWLRSLLRQRRHLGLAFALAHGVHLFAIVLFFNHAEDVFLRPATDFDSLYKNLVNVAGLLVYLLIASMVLTSNRISRRLMGKYWKKYHHFGMWVIFSIFLTNYMGRLAESNPSEPMITYYIILGVAITALILRIVADGKFRKTKRRVSAVSVS